MNKNVVLVQFNKRTKAGLIGSELDLIVGMKGYNPEKICSAFSLLSGKDLGLKDLELLLLIIDLEEALRPPSLNIPVVNPWGPGGTGTPRWPGAGEIICGSGKDMVARYFDRAVN